MMREEINKLQKRLKDNGLTADGEKSGDGRNKSN